MRYEPVFALRRQYFRDHFAEAMVTIVTVLLALDGWLTYIVR